MTPEKIANDICNKHFDLVPTKLRADIQKAVEDERERFADRLDNIISKLTDLDNRLAAALKIAKEE